MKKILVIEESSLLREFYNRQLTDHGFEVVVAVNGLDGVAKMRGEVPDLVIMDYFLSRANGPDVLARKQGDPNVRDVPVIMVSEPLEKEAVVQVAKYNVKKFFNKPVKLDDLLRAISELLKVRVEIDETPCMVEAHINDQVLFIEISQGLNREKIALLRYRIQELLNLYDVRAPKVLVMMASVEVGAGDSNKLRALLTDVLEATAAKARQVKILTRSPQVKKFIEMNGEFSDLEVTDSLETAMDGLFGRKTGNYLEKEGGRVQEGVLQSGKPRKEAPESINMRFSRDNVGGTVSGRKKQKIVVVDDDMVIQELIRTAFEDTGVDVAAYDDGADFIEDPGALESDLIFLDLMMPRKDGFSVLSDLNDKKSVPPVIVLSAISQKDSVIKAMKLGVKSYLIKPLKPENVLRKAAEVLGSNF